MTRACLLLLLASSLSAQEVHRITAYSHGCTLPKDGVEHKYPQRAANGEWPVANYTIAADWALYPKGTELIIEGEGMWTVTDKGRAIKGKTIDLFLANCRLAKKFGVRYLKVWRVPAMSTKWSK